MVRLRVLVELGSEGPTPDARHNGFEGDLEVGEGVALSRRMPKGRPEARVEEEPEHAGEAVVRLHTDDAEDLFGTEPIAERDVFIEIGPAGFRAEETEHRADGGAHQETWNDPRVLEDVVGADINIPRSASSSANIHKALDGDFIVELIARKIV